MSQRPSWKPTMATRQLVQLAAIASCMGFALVACQRVANDAQSSAPARADVMDPSAADDCVPTLRDGWIRPGPPGMPMMAGFGTLENACTTPGVVVAARSPAFGSVEIHESRLGEDGVSRMRPVPRLDIPAGGTATLAPGGLHLMLMQPAAPLEPGTRVEVTFRLDDGREARGDLEVLAGP